MHLWNPIKGEYQGKLGPVRQSLAQSDRFRTALRFLPGDQLLAIVAEDLRVDLWDIKANKLSHAWVVDFDKRSKVKALGQDYDFCHVALSSCGETMAWLASPPPEAEKGDSAVFVYETRTGKLVAELKGLPRADRIDLPDPGNSLVLYPPDPRVRERLITARGTVVDIAKGRVRFHFDYRIGAQPRAKWIRPQSAVIHRGCLLIEDGTHYSRWDMKTGKMLEECNHQRTYFAASADGRRLVFGLNKRWLVGDDLAPLRDNTHFWETPWHIGFLSDGRLFARGSGGYATGGSLHIWDPEKRKVVQSLWRHAPPADAVPEQKYTMSRLHRFLAYHGPKGIAVHDLEIDQPVSVIEGTAAIDMKDLGYPHLSPDGKRVLLFMKDGPRMTIRWYDAGTGKELGRHDIPDNERHDRDDFYYYQTKWYTDDGTVFGYQTRDYRLKLVKCADAAPPVMIGFPVEREANEWTQVWRFTSVGFDRLFLAERYRMRRPADTLTAEEFSVWNRQGQVLRRCWLQAEPTDKGFMYWRCKLSHDGRILAAQAWRTGQVGREHFVFFYELATGRQLGKVQLADGFVHIGMDFSPDGKRFATSCTDTTLLLWNLDRPLSGKADLTAPATMKEAEQLWTQLGAADPKEAELARRALVRAPKLALPLLQKHLLPDKTPDKKSLQALIARLGSRNFQERDAAQKELQRIGAPVLQDIIAALKAKPTLEQRRRLESLATSIDWVPAEANEVPPCLRELRALEVLERLATPESRAMIEAIAAGHRHVLVSREAWLILDRWPGPS